MKRSILVLAVAALSTIPMAANAQGFGILGGLSYGTIPNNNGALPGTLHANSGFAVGLGAETGGVVGVGLNALYAQRGFTSTVTGYSQQLSFIDLPLYLRVAIPTHVVTPFALIGPQISFELNCSGGNCPSGRASTTYAGVVGAGLKFHVLGGLSFQGRYIYGLSNLNYNTVNNTNNYQTRSFMLLLGFGI